MQLHVEARHIAVLHGERLAGRYAFGDRHKPHLHPLCTPKGHEVTLYAPHDHKHHKGLMYGLRTREVNFWEEYPSGEGVKVGVQRHEGFDEVMDRGEEVRFVERLTWAAEDGTSETFLEMRKVSCTALPDGAGYAWSWRSRLETLRDVELVMSPFSVPRADGKPVNYHGLGVRLPRSFGCTGGNRLLVDGVPTAFAAALGEVARSVAFEGSLDAITPTEAAGIRIEQDQGHALFVLDAPFAYLSFGPSNRAPLRLDEGESLEEGYRMTVYDCAPPPRMPAA